MMAVYFFLNETATTEIYTLSLHDALPISASLTADECAPWGNPITVLGNTAEPSRSSEHCRNQSGLQQTLAVPSSSASRHPSSRSAET
mgnify:CR=1 FL=1